MVGRVWFEHTKPKRLIYSQMVLATYLPAHEWWILRDSNSRPAD